MEQMLYTCTFHMLILWMLIFTLVLKCKRAYHQACKVRDQTERLYKEACVEGSTVNEEQVKKLKDKSEKAANDVQVTKGKYEESLRDIGNYNPKYVEDMRYVFNKCQQSEEERKNFFKQTLLNYCQQMSLAPHFNRLVPWKWDVDLASGAPNDIFLLNALQNTF